MSIPLVVNSKTFNYPNTNEEPGWGEDATKWAKEVTRVLNSLAGSNDILLTSGTVNNNVSSPSDVSGLLFNTSVVKSAVIEYNIYRMTNTTELAESGTITVVYKPIAATWNMTQTSNGDAQTYFTITNGGQVQYTSSSLGGTGYTGTIRFTAKAMV